MVREDELCELGHQQFKTMDIYPLEATDYLKL